MITEKNIFNRALGSDMNEEGKKRYDLPSTPDSSRAYDTVSEIYEKDSSEDYLKEVFKKEKKKDKKPLDGDVFPERIRRKYEEDEGFEKKIKNFSDYERLLTHPNIKRCARYLTQCIEGLQFEQAIVNLSTIKYKGKPLSNSLLIGIIAMDEEFKVKGYDFSSEELERDSSIRYETRDRRMSLLKKIREPSINSLREQFFYLYGVAKERGLNLSPGSILIYSPFSPIVEVKEAREKDPFLKIGNKSKKSKNFMISLLEEEPEYGKIFLEIFKDKKGNLKNYLFENFSQELKNV